MSLRSAPSPLAALVVAGFAMAAPATADAARYTFSFVNVSGAVGGTVSGMITLPDGDGKFAATSLVVTAAPAALSYAIGFDFMSRVPLENAFTVAGGTITLAGTEFLGFFNGSTVLAIASMRINSATSLPNGSFLDALNGRDRGASGVQDAANATVTFAPAAVPAPAALGIFALAALGLGVAMRGRGASAA